MKKIFLLAAIGLLTTLVLIRPCDAGEWAVTYGEPGSYCEAVSIQLTSDGGYIVGGNKAIGAGTYDFWVLKLDSAGSIVWQKTYGHETYGWSTDERIRSIQPTSDGNYVVAGYSVYRVDPDTYVEDWWILKLDSLGSILWQKTYGGSFPSPDHAYSIRETTDGGYIAAGYTTSFDTQGGSAFWVMKLNSAGSILWQKAYDGGWSRENAHAIQQTLDGGYIVAGVTLSLAVGDDDIWILKLRADGSIEWQKTYGGSGEDRPWVIQQTTEGGYILAGDTTSSGAGRRDFLGSLRISQKAKWMFSLKISCYEFSRAAPAALT